MKNKREHNEKILEAFSGLKPSYLRPLVDWYAKRMEKRLREKDATRGEDGWHDSNYHHYLVKAAGCITKIFDITRITILDNRIGSEIKEKDIHFAIKKCVDGGNFFMMLADNLRDELLKRGIKQGGE